jgi:hypothetical protein
MSEWADRRSLVSLETHMRCDAVAPHLVGMG